MPNTSRSARQRILDVASTLFYRDGFRAVGIDTIIADSGVAKMTLYRHFPTKDDLIVAYLEHVNHLFWAWFEGALGTGTPQEQLLALFENLGARATSPVCFGCSFQHAAADFPNPDHPGHRVALAHKQAVLARLCALTTAADAREPQTLAGQLLLLMDGAFIAARIFGPNNHAVSVAQAAVALLAAQLPQP